MKYSSLSLMVKVALVSFPNRTARIIDISSKMGAPYASIQQTLKNLVDQGLVTKCGRGVYQLSCEVKFTTDEFIAMINDLSQARKETQTAYEAYEALRATCSFIEDTIKDSIQNI